MNDDEKTDPGTGGRASAPTIRSNQRMPELGAISTLMNDPSITEIMINDVRNVMVEKEGKIMFSGFTFQSPEELSKLVHTILKATGNTLDPDQPYLDASLPDGSRINIIAPPLTQAAPCLTIRKFPTTRFSIEDLIKLEMLDVRIAQFLKACVMGKMNILICGGTGSGKTTFLNALTQLVPKSERIITIEDTLELVVQHPNSVRLQSKLETRGHPGVSARELVANALRMRPDRILVGECRRGEAFDMLQAMNTGHGGSMTTIHANSPRDGLFRLETLCLMAGVELPLIAIRKQINSALDLVIQIKRFRSGKRRLTQISEVTGTEGDTITMQDIFTYETDPRNPTKTDVGHFRGTGFVPTFLERLAENGVELPKNFFA
jgi:pilus assembly protein CpaF